MVEDDPDLERHSGNRSLFVESARVGDLGAAAEARLYSAFRVLSREDIWEIMLVFSVVPMIKLQSACNKATGELTGRQDDWLFRTPRLGVTTFLCRRRLIFCHEPLAERVSSALELDSSALT